ncbi:MAG: RluA family pseudouridine synthase [Rhodothermales bacterium]|nr:RluA family pseudouridine synthase [Rhodothermales bacterium]
MEMEREETQIILEVPAGYTESERLDVYITGFVANATRTKVQQALQDERVRVNDRVVTRSSYRVQGGDHIVCTVLRQPPVEARPEAIPLEIVYEDAWLLVVNKRAGMVVHPAYGNRTGTLVNALLHHLGAGPISFETEEEEEEEVVVGLSMATARPRGMEGIDIRPGIVHRLDKDTSGLLVVAKDDATHAHLARQFYDRTSRRTYEALVWGEPTPREGVIETSLFRDSRDRRKMAVVPAEKGKRAVTHYALIESFGYTSHLQFRLETGRTHQIRVHAEYLRHPILGDATYGGQEVRFGPQSSKRASFFRNLFERMPRQALHARTLGFTHPKTGVAMDFDSPVPEDMAWVMERLRDVDALLYRGE